MCCVFLCNLSQQPPVCPLVVCFVWQKSAVVQAADRTKLASPVSLESCVWYHVFSGQSWHYWGIQAGCVTQIEQILIHLWLFTSWVNILSFLGTQIFFFYVIGVLLLWKSYWYPPIWVSWQIVIFTATKSHKWTSGLLAHIFLGWKMSVFFFFFF